MDTKLVTIPLMGLSLDLPTAVDQVKIAYGKALAEAAKLLLAGEVVAFPTETVYGLGGNAYNPLSAGKIYQAKGRPMDNPLIVHVAKIEQVQEIAQLSPLGEKLLKAFSPGPLTLILPKKDVIPQEVSGGLGTVGVRIPAHPVALGLLETCNLPIAAPSANISGKPSPTTGLHVYADLAGKISMVIDSGGSKVGLESTVLDLTVEPPVILRPGKITQADLLPICGEVLLAGDRIKINNTEAVAPKAPGMKYRHYAPVGKVELVEPVAFVTTYAAKSKENPKEKIALLATKAQLKQVELKADDVSYALGEDQQDLPTVAQELFGALRYCDQVKADLILVEKFQPEGLGAAIMNRLVKAAAKQ